MEQRAKTCGTRFERAVFAVSRCLPCVHKCRADANSAMGIMPWEELARLGKEISPGRRARELESWDNVENGERAWQKGNKKWPEGKKTNDRPRTERAVREWMNFPPILVEILVGYSAVDIVVPWQCVRVRVWWNVRWWLMKRITNGGQFGLLFIFFFFRNRLITWSNS